MPFGLTQKELYKSVGFCCLFCFQKRGEREKENGLMNSVRVQSTLLKIT